MAEFNIDTWGCSKCTYQNAGSQQKCEMCHTKKICRQKSVSYQWTCSACTYVNEGSQHKCAVCYAKRTKNQWICTSCYYWNEQENINCVKCSSSHGKKVSDGISVPSHGDGKIDNENIRKKKLQRQISRDDIDLPSIGKHSKQNSKNYLISSQKAGDLWGYKASHTTDITASKEKHKINIIKSKDIPKTIDTSKSKDVPKFKEQASKVENKDIWSCKWCTFYNKLDDNVCQMCYSPKSAVEKKQPQDKMLKRGQLHANCQSVRAVNVRQREEREARIRWERIVQTCKKNGTKFVDNNFPPCLKSLYDEPWAGSKNPKWLRCCDIQSEDKSHSKDSWVVYRSPTTPEDISQGALGNCWYLSALAVLAYREDLLEKIIITKSYCPEGAYMVRLCKDGYWKIILIDDLFPCDQYDRLLYSKAKRRQLWVPLIEKAAAKLHGCYGALSSGRSIEALSLLTGEPCERIDLHETDTRIPINKVKIWSKLVHARESNFLMGTSCGSGKMQNVDHEHYKTMGLVSLHAYSLLDVQDFDGHKLIQIRNPWGSESWKGDWCDGSPKWKDLQSSTRNGIKTDGNKKGIFWMAFKDFLKYFDSVDICKARSDWQESRHKGTFPPHSAQPWKFFKLAVIDDTQINLGLFQKSMRGMGRISETLVDLLMVVLEDNEDGKTFKWVIKHSHRETRSFVGCDVELKPGKYTVACLAFKHWKTSGTDTFKTPDQQYRLNKDFVLTIHSSELVITEEVDTSLDHFKYMLADTVIQLAIDKGVKQDVQKDFRTYSLDWCGGIFVVENSSTKQFAHIECDYSQSSYVISTRVDFVTRDSIPPRHRQVLVVLSPLEVTAGWKFSRKISCKLTSKRNLSSEWAKSDVEHLPEISKLLAGLHEPQPF